MASGKDGIQRLLYIISALGQTNVKFVERLVGASGTENSDVVLAPTLWGTYFRSAARK